MTSPHNGDRHMWCDICSQRLPATSNWYETGLLHTYMHTSPSQTAGLKPDKRRMSRAKTAIQRGATAVVLDITDNPSAADDLSDRSLRLDRPVIVLQGSDASKLMEVVDAHMEARIRIMHARPSQPAENVEINKKEYFGMAIFVAVFLLFCVICVFFMLKVSTGD
ncbi:E3 ubiquitin-protein ligase znrf3 [Bulinus truncatus]|nr:E3 ubiquitin-protein ligase znrf3 [Bulinus truncatus]